MGRKNGNRNCNVIMCQAHIDRGWLDSDVHRRARKKIASRRHRRRLLSFYEINFLIGAFNPLIAKLKLN